MLPILGDAGIVMLIATISVGCSIGPLDTARIAQVGDSFSSRRSLLSPEQ